MIPFTRAEEAENWLRDALNVGGRPAKELFRAAKAEGIPRRTLQRAADVLNVGRERKGFGEGSSWSLPTVIRANETPGMARMGTNGANDGIERVKGLLAELGAISRRFEEPGKPR